MACGIATFGPAIFVLLYIDHEFEVLLLDEVGSLTSRAKVTAGHLIRRSGGFREDEESVSAIYATL